MLTAQLPKSGQAGEQGDYAQTMTNTKHTEQLGKVSAFIPFCSPVLSFPQLGDNAGLFCPPGSASGKLWDWALQDQPSWSSL